MRAGLGRSPAPAARTLPASRSACRATPAATGCARGAAARLTRPACRAAAPDSPPSKAQSEADPELRQLLGDAFLRPQFEEHSDEHVTELVEAAAGLISVIDDLRPLEPGSFNPFVEIWKAIAAVPPADRARVLEELEPGALLSLWRASIGRYVLPDEDASQLLGGFSIWADFPAKPGEVYEYAGLCEQFTYQKAPRQLGVDAAMQARFPRAVPWLKPNPSSMATPQERFRMQFFQANRTGLLHSRMLLEPPGALAWASRWLSPPVYARLELGLTLLPASSDAGADACLAYPMDLVLLRQKLEAGVALSKADLPSPLWPSPLATPGWSPFSFEERDYLRVAGPGFYVGCAYRRNEAGELLDDEHVYFALVRTTY